MARLLDSFSAQLYARLDASVVGYYVSNKGKRRKFRTSQISIAQIAGSVVNLIAAFIRNAAHFSDVYSRVLRTAMLNRKTLEINPETRVHFRDCSCRLSVGSAPRFSHVGAVFHYLRRPNRHISLPRARKICLIQSILAKVRCLRSGSRCARFFRARGFAPVLGTLIRRRRR